MPEPLSSIFAVAGKFIAGFFGAAISLRFVPGLSLLEKIGFLLAGTLTAGYLGEPLAQLVGVPENTAAFIVGLFGMSVADAIVRAVKETDIAGIVKGRFGNND